MLKSPNYSRKQSSSKPNTIEFERKHPQDVLGGKGKGILMHNNQTFWHHEIMRLKPAYLRMQNSEAKKTKMAEEIVDEVRRLGGDFYDIPDEDKEGSAKRKAATEKKEVNAKKSKKKRSEKFELMKHQRAVEKTMRKLRQDASEWRSKLPQKKTSSCPTTEGSNTSPTAFAAAVPARESILLGAGSRAFDSNQETHNQEEEQGTAGNHCFTHGFPFRRLAQSSLLDVDSHSNNPSSSAPANGQFITIDRSAFSRLIHSYERMQRGTRELIGNTMKVFEMCESETQSRGEILRLVEGDILPKVEALQREERRVEQEQELERLRSENKMLRSENSLLRACDASQKQDIADLEAKLYGSCK